MTILRPRILLFDKIFILACCLLVPPSVILGFLTSPPLMARQLSTNSRPISTEVNSGCKPIVSSASFSSLSSSLAHFNKHDNDLGSDSRRRFLQWVGVTAGISALLGDFTFPTASYAASDADGRDEEIPLPTREMVTSSFDAIRYELQHPQGGVALMQERIDQEDWVGLMDFTKTYDLELRKKLMGRAKKLLQSKDIKNDATTFANGVTFDLIGINRASRKGQESVSSANKYLQELRDDISKFLALESTIQVQP